jgi:menaquinone-specific isochorismate synthase
MAVFSERKIDHLNDPLGHFLPPLPAIAQREGSHYLRVNFPPNLPLGVCDARAEQNELSAFLTLLAQIKHTKFAQGLQRISTNVTPSLQMGLNPSLNFLQRYKTHWQHQHSYWRNREQSFEMAGLGQSIVLSLTRSDDVIFDKLQTNALDTLFVQMHQICRGSDACFIGVTAFDDQKNGTKQDIWHSFEGTKFVLPALTLEKRQLSHAADGYQLCAHLYASQLETEHQWLQKKNTVISNIQRCINTLLNVERTTHTRSSAVSAPEKIILKKAYSMDYGEWQQQVERVQKLMNSKDKKESIKKIVLSRAVTLTMAAPIDALPILNQWQRLEKNCFSFVLSHQMPPQKLQQPYSLLKNNHSVFMGCSPERLYQREHQALTTESLAGTVARSSNVQHDAA